MSLVCAAVISPTNAPVHVQTFGAVGHHDDESADHLEKAIRCGGGLAKRGLANWVSGKVNESASRRAIWQPYPAGCGGKPGDGLGASGAVGDTGVGESS